MSARPFVTRKTWQRLLPRWAPARRFRRVAWVALERAQGRIVLVVPAGSYQCQCGEVTAILRTAHRDGLAAVGVVPFDEHGTEPPLCDCCGDTLSQIVNPR